MIAGIALTIFLLSAPFIWRKGPEGTGLAFMTAAAMALLTAVFATATGLTGFGKDWRVEAIFFGLVLAMSFISLGIARAS